MSDHEKMTHERRLAEGYLINTARHLLSKQSIAAGVVLELGDGAIVAAGKQDAILMLLKPSPVAPEQDQAIAEVGYRLCDEGSFKKVATARGFSDFSLTISGKYHDPALEALHAQYESEQQDSTDSATPAAHIASKPNADVDTYSLAEAIAKAAEKRGIIAPGVSLTGPQLVMLCADLATPAASAPTVPEGWKLVPVEPTDDMVLAPGALRTGGNVARIHREVWARMLAAAPAAPAAPSASADAVIEAREQALEFNEAQIAAAGRALADRNAKLCNVDKDDNWKIYGEEFITDARVALDALRTQATKGE